MSNFTERDKAAARAIVSVFETSKEQGDYAALVVLADKAGISYGAHQATHGSGSLELVLREFAARAPAHQVSANKWAALVADRRPANVAAVSRNMPFKAWLRQAGTTPEMRAAQESVFDTNYMEPALRVCAQAGFVEPLSLAIVYDAHIQGGWAKCRERTNALHQSPVAERRWIADYLNIREGYLGSLPSQDQRNTVYRPKALRGLVRDGNWKLVAPFMVRGRTIDESEL